MTEKRLEEIEDAVNIHGRTSAPTVKWLITEVRRLQEEKEYTYQQAWADAHRKAKQWLEDVSK